MLGVNLILVLFQKIHCIVWLMGKDKDPCQRHACQLQTCLAKNGFQESKCQHELR